MTGKNITKLYFGLFILLFLGMCFQLEEADASFSCVHNESIEEIVTISMVTETEESCTNEMLGKTSVRICNNRSQRYTLVNVVSETSDQHLIVYLNEEAKEDGQIFLNRTISIEYIHLIDGEPGVLLF